MTPGHTHNDGRITFGCPGCIALAEQARLDNAPLRLCVWHCDYMTPDPADQDLRIFRSLTFALKVRVPDGWTGDQVDRQYAGLTGEAFALALPDDVPTEHTDWACETMEVTKVVIGEIVLDAPAVTMVQESLL